jgi:formylglycine-generating enzyme required for sulfatase activity
MHGNVRQWTQDAYTDKLGGKENDRGELIAEPSLRVMRGGCWDGDARVCRAADRAEFAPGYGINLLGFRLARVPVEVGGK